MYNIYFCTKRNGKCIRFEKTKRAARDVYSTSDTERVFNRKPDTRRKKTHTHTHTQNNNVEYLTVSMGKIINIFIYCFLNNL